VESCANLFGRKSEQKTGREPAAVAAEGARTVEKTMTLRACSACGGDYEDPDCTAWGPDESEDDVTHGEDDAARGCGTEEFPAEK
jgi:hypothetical protein